MDFVDNNNFQILYHSTTNYIFASTLEMQLGTAQFLPMVFVTSTLLEDCGTDKDRIDKATLTAAC